MTTKHNIPKSEIILTGKYVTLRPLTVADCEDVFASLDDAESARLTGTQRTFTIEDVRAHLERCETASDRYDFAIAVKGESVGEIVLNQIDWNNLCASYRIAIWSLDSRNRGFGTEASKLLLRFAFETLRLNRVELEVYAFNPRAIRVYQRLGFVMEGTRREALYWDDEWIDAHIMAMLKRDYPAALEGGD